jgi:hypothetical protein
MHDPMCKFPLELQLNHSSYERGGVETLSRKLLEKEEKKKYTLESPLVNSKFLVFIPPIKMWSDNTKPELKGKRKAMNMSNECVQQRISQKIASIQSTMLLLTLIDFMHLLVSNYPYPKPPNPILSHYGRLDLTLQSYPYFIVHFCSREKGD